MRLPLLHVAIIALLAMPLPAQELYDHFADQAERVPEPELVESTDMADDAEDSSDESDEALSGEELPSGGRFVRMVSAANFTHCVTVVAVSRP